MNDPGLNLSLLGAALTAGVFPNSLDFRGPPKSISKAERSRRRKKAKRAKKSRKRNR